MAKAEEVSTRDVRDTLDKLEVGIERLRVAYDKYFTGVDRIAPQSLSDKVHRLLREAEAMRPRQTALRFRLNGLRARLVTYRHYWTRVMTQIENGTYRRHLQRVQRHKREAEAAAAKPPAAESASEPLDDLDAMLDAAIGLDDRVADPAATAPAAAAKRPAVKAPPPPPPSVPGMDPRKVRALYQELVKAKTAAGEDTRGLTYRGLCKQLARDAPKLRKQHGKITFVVARDGGRVRLKAKVGGSG